ncbi:MAG: hypothetical protein HZB70_01225 [Candidatus Berkelbacteria bacterium]|nr:MAG: hypothetical protein HZB70_01225 [Candidatus Berkelbacteria bacterium]QQG52039.1 MAG: hypothetical protein HY845_01770 [Candidatus Berkelbacteria bacterium]
MKVVILVIVACFVLGCQTVPKEDVAKAKADFLQRTRGVVNEESVSCHAWDKLNPYVRCSGVTAQGKVISAVYQWNQEWCVTFYSD